MTGWWHVLIGVVAGLLVVWSVMVASLWRAQRHPPEPARLADAVRLVPDIIEFCGASRLIGRCRAGSGWAALSGVFDRCVYAGVAENSLYIHPDHRGHGVGHALLQALVESAEHSGIWTVQTGIFPENQTSIAVHQATGFRVVCRRERIGQLNGTWRDTMLLERLSTAVGQ